MGHGAAATTMTCMELTSWRARTVSGSSTMRLSRVGAMKVLVHRWRAMAASAASGSNFGSTTTVPPKTCAYVAKPPGAE